MQPHWEEGTYPPLDPRARAAAAPDPCTLATITVEVERGSESERGRESERREWISWGDGATEGVDRVDWLGLVSSAHRCRFFLKKWYLQYIICVGFNILYFNTYNILL